MKSLLAMLLMAVLVFGAACGSGSSNNKTNGAGNTDNSKSAQSSSNSTSKDQSAKKENMSDLMDWELNMLPVIHKTTDPFNTLTKIAGDEKKTEWTDGDKDTIKALIPQAVKAGNSFAENVKDVQIPSSLPKAEQEKIKSAIDDLTAYFKAKAKAVKDLKNPSSLKDYKKKVDTMNQAGMDKFKSFVSTVKSLEKKAGFDAPNGMKGEF